MEAHCSTMAADMRWEDVVQPTEAVKARLEASVVPPPTEPNVILTAAELSAIIPTITELPSSSLTVPSANAAGAP